MSYGKIKKSMSVSQLGTAGYRAVTRGNRNARVRGWIVYQRNTDEIDASKTLLAKDGGTAERLFSNIYTYPRTGEVIELAVQPCSRAPP